MMTGRAPAIGKPKAMGLVPKTLRVAPRTVTVGPAETMVRA